MNKFTPQIGDLYKSTYGLWFIVDIKDPDNKGYGYLPNGKVFNITTKYAVLFILGKEETRWGWASIKALKYYEKL